MFRVLFCAGFALFAAGCTSAGNLEQAGPDVTRQSSLQLNVAANCLVKFLDQASFDSSGFGKSISHRIETKAIGEKYRVTHADVLTVASQSYMIDVTGRGGGSRLDGYAVGVFLKTVRNAINAC